MLSFWRSFGYEKMGASRKEKKMEHYRSIVRVLGLVFVGLLDSSCDSPRTPLASSGRACRTSVDCYTQEHCGKAQGNCEGMGECRARPERILPGMVVVCGCNGKTYDGPSFAYALGTTVAYEGECEKEPG